MTTAPLSPIPLASPDASNWSRAHAPVRIVRSYRIHLLFVLCLFSALLGRAAYIIRPFDSDSSMFIFEGRLASEGKSLCRDMIDNKLPTVGLAMSLPFRIAGPWWPGYVLMQTAMGLGMTAVVWRTARRHIGPD